MTIWQPDLTDSSSPRYLAIAEALARDLDAGRLAVGVRLPTHRELARRLGVTVGTVSRAYAEAERRGLVRGEVGRGTFVRRPAPEAVVFGEPPADAAELIDLAPSVPASPLHAEEEALLRGAFASLSRSRELASLLECQPHAGRWRHREAGAAWVSELGCAAGAERVVVTSGGQHAMAVAFATLARPGEVVLTEELTFPGMKGLANLMRLRLQGVAMDRQGLRPDAFERACREGDSKLLYTIPTHQNPTATVIPEQRRLEIVEIAARHGVTIVEDDIYGFLPDGRPPPFVALAPERCCAVHSVSKLLVPGLRVGFLVAPEGLVERLAANVWATTWMAAPPMAEIVARWIDDGTIRRFAAWRRDEARARNVLAGRILAEACTWSDPCGYHLWLELPEPWSSRDFVDQARRRGVAVCGPEVFVAGRGRIPHAVRVALQAPRERRRLEEGLRILAELLREPPEPCVAIA